MRLSSDQLAKIEQAYKDVWNNIIYDTVLTQEQRDNPTAMKVVAAQMETVLERQAAAFGLSALS